MERIKSAEKEAGLGGMPVYLTDWNALTGTTVAEAGEFHRTALIAMAVYAVGRLNEGD